MNHLLIKTVTLFILLFFTSSCLKGDDDMEIIQLDNQEIIGKITNNTTWTSDKIYILKGKVIVPDGITLTIQPGTIIKGELGDGLNASALLVARGGKLIAQGTENNPIIFTSVLDNIQIGEKVGTNLSETDVKKWGGLIILGKANVSDKVGDTQGHIEGIPADADYGTYGGNKNNDNSGILSYVSIRHGGISIGDGNEINGLTLAGVGSETTIDYIEIVATLDDGIECFGGTVTINHALVAYQQDDAFDIDQNFAGKFINSVVIYDNTGDEFLEIDGPENNTYKNGKFTIENCKFISKTNDGTVDLKSKAQGYLINNVFEGLNTFKISAKLDSDCTTLLNDAYNNYLNHTLEIAFNNTDAGLQIYTKSKNDMDFTCQLPSYLLTDATAIFNTANNSINSNIEFNEINELYAWSWTVINNKF